MKNRIESEFQPAKESVRWANEAIKEFDNQAATYFSAESREIITDVDPKTLRKVHKIRLRGPLPTDLRRKATESITRTKEAFDQAIFAVCNLTNGLHRKLVYFPWANNPTDLKRLLEERCIDRRFWDLFETYQPYPTNDGYAGGSDMIRALARMANDKHTVGLRVQPFVTAFKHPLQEGVFMKYFFPPSWDPISHEATIATWEGDIEPNRGYDIKFKILFDENRFPYSVNATAALGAFTAAAEMVIDQLQRRCEELLS